MTTWMPIVERIEKQQGTPLPLPSALIAVWARSHNSEQMLEARATWLANEWSLPDMQRRAARAWQLLWSGFCLLIFLSGMLAADRLLNADTGVINVFWLLVALLGANTLFLVLWMASLMLPASPASSPASWLAQALVHLLKYLTPSGTTNPPSRAATPSVVVRWQAVLHSQLTCKLQRWNLAFMSHLIWMIFLIGTLAMLLLGLSAQQFDFVWGTTLLTEQHFIGLTQSLGALPKWMGIPVADVTVVMESRQGLALSPQGADARMAWAGLVLGALIFYGLMPRGLLACLSHILARRAKCSMPPDEAFYQSVLMQCQQVHTRHEGVLDAEISSPESAQSSESPNHCADIRSEKSSEIAQSANWPQGLGLGLSPQWETDWRTLNLEISQWLGNLDGHASESTLMASVRSDQPCLILAAIDQLPDRGHRRLLRQLKSRCRTPGLGLLPARKTQSFRKEWLLLARHEALPVMELSEAASG